MGWLVWRRKWGCFWGRGLDLAAWLLSEGFVYSWLSFFVVGGGGAGGNVMWLCDMGFM